MEIFFGVVRFNYKIILKRFYLLLVAFYHLQDVLVFCPVIPINSRIVIDKPSAVGLNFEETYEPKFGPLKLHLYLMLQPDSKSCCTIIFFHGNAGNIGHRLENAKGMYHTLKANILLVEYRGFGKSNGTPSESGLYCDADIAIHYLLERTDIDREKIIIFGRSIGNLLVVGLCNA